MSFIRFTPHHIPLKYRSLFKINNRVMDIYRRCKRWLQWEASMIKKLCFVSHVCDKEEVNYHKNMKIFARMKVLPQEHCVCVFLFFFFFFWEGGGKRVPLNTFYNEGNWWLVTDDRVGKTYDQNMCHSTIGSGLIKIPLPYKLSMGSWLGTTPLR